MKAIALVAALLAVATVAFWLWTPDRSRAYLEQRYLADPHDMREVGAWRLHVRDTGPRDAAAIILIHGFASSLQTWDTWAPLLDRTHRVIRLDLPGSGLSPPDPVADYTDARSVEIIIALMDELGLRRATVGGHSIGGRISWTFASLHPERVDALVLVAPDGFASPGFAYGRAPHVPAWLGLMRHVLPKALLRMNLAQAYSNPVLLTDSLIDRYDDLIRAPGAREALLDRMRQTVLTDPRPRLAAIRVPTLLIWGTCDAMIPIANADDYLKAMPNARLVSLPGSGHLPQEDAGAESAAIVAKFLM